MLMAMGEAPLPIAIDPRTLETRGEWPWRDDILLGADGNPRPQHTTPHPHFDRATGDLINNVEIFARECRYEIHRGPRDSKRRRFAVVPVERPAYMHSFGMSEHYVVLAEYPLVADVQAIAARKRPFIENYEWLPDRGTIFTVVSKADGTVVARAQSEPCLGIHQINCFERDGAIVFDVPAYPEGRHICNLYLDHVSRQCAGEVLIAILADIAERRSDTIRRLRGRHRSDLTIERIGAATEAEAGIARPRNWLKARIFTSRWPRQNRFFRN